MPIGKVLRRVRPNNSNHEKNAIYFLKRLLNRQMGFEEIFSKGTEPLRLGI